MGEREPRRRRRAGSRDSDDSPREDRGRGESGRDSTRRDEGRREDTRRDERRDDTRQSDSRAALDRSPRNGSRSSAAARKALTSGGYQLPPLNIVDAIDPADYPPAFRELGLSDRALAVMASLGFDAPTPIQEEAVPMMLDGHDVVGQAQTGTGKTLAFGLLIVERLDPELRQVQAIVLVPTRELAQQVFGVLEFLAEAMGLRAMPLVGGRKLNDDFDNLEKRPQIVVGTPGRIIDHLNRGSLDLGEVRVAVLDEADRMLDIGFEPDMRRILSRCPDNRQTALFSATIPTAIKTLIWRYMHEPEHIQIEPEQATAREIYQRYFEVAEQDKLKALSELLPEMQGRTLIFCNMKVTVDRLVSRLQDRNILAEAIHGDLDQRKRDRVMERFRAGELQFLVATNVASRGLDIPDLNHVVNFDLPQNADEYVHRVGRTGRAGREGSAITFVSEWDYDSFEAIKKLAGDDLQPGDLSLYAGSR
ncbi:MAG: ATP-dependent RNA helicase DeaD [Chloroflexi bacterium]|nr:MAG: ATP-dependent RNA helicase DeaD [Chloroflexota bacterium]